MRIETERLIIRDFDYLDLDEYHRITSDEEVAYLAGFKPHFDIKTSKYQLQSIILMHDYYAITLKDNTLIGDLNFYKDPLRKAHDAFQIGFLLNKNYWHNGYMQEALKAFIEYLYMKYDIDILTCVTLVKNENSQKTIEKVGFKYDGIIRHYKRLYNGDMADCKIYSMTKFEIERNLLIWQKN